MSDSWSYFQNGKAEGPVNEAELRRLLSSGILTWDDLVWREGLAEWTKASQFPELRAPFIALDEPAAPPAPQRQASPAMRPYQASAAPVQAGLEDALDALRATKPWARFMGVMGFLSTALLILVAVGVMLAGSFLQGMPEPLRTILPLIYLVMAGLQLPPAIFLNRYAGRIRDALASRDAGDVAEALRAQKSFWVYVGVLTLVVTILYALIFIGGVAFGALAASHRL